ncbi:MAG TPA: carbohydrate binding domain-containing protein [Ramlibacter sp.]
MSGFRGCCAEIVRVAGAAGLALALAACGGGDPADARGAGVSKAMEASRSLSASRAPLRSAAANLLSNPGFEAGMTGWVDWGNSQVVDGAGASGASRALRVGIEAGGTGHDVDGIVPGSTYRLTAQARVSEPAETVYLGVNMLDAGGAIAARQVLPASSTSFSTATVAITAPANAVKAVVFVWKNAGSGHAFLDDFIFAAADASPPPPSGTSPNLVSNADFEAGMSAWANWGNSVVLDGAGAAASRALRVGTAAGGAGSEVGGIAAGATYRLTAQVKVSDSSEVAYVGINILDQAGAAVAQQAAPASSLAYSPTTVDITAPATAARAVVYIWKNAGSGYAYLDDVVLARTEGSTEPPPTEPPPAEPPPSEPPPTEPPPSEPPPSEPPPEPANLVANAGFETGLASWTNWGNATAAAAHASSGSYAVHVGSGAGGLGQDVASITPGRTYSLSGQVKVSSGSELAYLGLRFMDAAGANLLERSVAFSSTVYSTAKLDLVAPANAARALVYVWKNDGTGFAYVDDVALAPVAQGTSGPKAVIIGNSITYSIATPSIGWDHTSGMSASATETDFAHLVAAALGVESPTVTNFSALERDPAANKWLIPDYTAAIDAATAVTIELGDNVALARLSEFADAYDALLAAARHGRSLVCVSTWWKEPSKDAVIASACEAHAGTYVYIGDIFTDPANRDRLEGPQYTDPSVQDHPHDWSMARIAERIVAAHAR